MAYTEVLKSCLTVYYSHGIIAPLEQRSTESITTMNYDNMSREDLIAYIESIRIDKSFNILKKESALVEWTIADGDQVIFMDIVAMHSANHLYGMDGVDSFIRNITDWIRVSDKVAKFGGDEIVIVLQSNTNAWHYMERLAVVMANNNMYGTIAATTALNGLENTIKKLDAIVMTDKLESEKNGTKADRCATYVCGESTIIYAV